MLALLASLALATVAANDLYIPALYITGNGFTQAQASYLWGGSGQTGAYSPPMLCL